MQWTIKAIVNVVKENFVISPAVSREVCREGEPAVVVIPADGCVLAPVGVVLCPITNSQSLMKKDGRIRTHTPNL